jgi:hypothetical protein
LAGRPLGDDGTTTEWDEVVAGGTAAIDMARGELHFSGDDLSHRRGNFAAKAFGILDGLGQKVGPLRCKLVPVLTPRKAAPDCDSGECPQQSGHRQAAQRSRDPALSGLWKRYELI